MNIGILGMAHGHVNGYLSQWKEHPEYGVTATAVWDHNAERLRSASEQHGLAPIADLETLLADRSIPAVIITAETSYHAELVERAAAAGKAIILQKPLALTLAEADRMVSAVQRTGVPFTMAWQMRVDPQNIQMKEIMASGVLGRILNVRRRHGLNAHRWPNFADMWHFKPELNRDIWADDAAHPIDLLHWMLGVPESVTAEMMTLSSPQMPMDNGIAILRYPNGPLAEVCCSFTCVAAENTTEIIGEKGVIIQSFGDAVSMTAPRQPEVSGLKWFLADTNEWIYSDIPTPASHFDRIMGLAHPLADFLNGKRPPIATAEEARTSLRIVLATYVSLREGRRVMMDDAGIAAV